MADLVRLRTGGAIVRLSRSSAVEVIDGDTVKRGPFLWLTVVRTASETYAHLTRAEVRRLHKALGKWIEEAARG